MKVRILALALLLGSNAYGEKARAYPRYLHGAIVPMVTPYSGLQGQRIDREALARLTGFLCGTRASALFPVSGTGQWGSLSMPEKKEVIETVLAAARKRKPILAGVGSPRSIDEVIELARFAEKEGADGIMVVTPAWVRARQPKVAGRHRILDQRLLIDFYTKVSEAVHLPVIVYDPEGEVEPATMGFLVDQCKTIKGIKYGQADRKRFREMASAVRGRAAVLAGSENHALEAIRNGAVGAVGNGFNIYPDLGAELIDACDRGDWDRAAALQATIADANTKIERLGGGAQGVKKILNDVFGVKMSTVNRGDRFRPESYPGEYDAILAFFRRLASP